MQSSRFLFGLVCRYMSVTPKLFTLILKHIATLPGRFSTCVQ